jgi:hypothetical protein
MSCVRQRRCNLARNSLAGGYNASPEAPFSVKSAPTQITHKKCSTTPLLATFHIHVPIDGCLSEIRKKKALEGLDWHHDPHQHNASEPISERARSTLRITHTWELSRPTPYCYPASTPWPLIRTKHSVMAQSAPLDMAKTAVHMGFSTLALFSSHSHPTQGESARHMYLMIAHEEHSPHGYWDQFPDHQRPITRQKPTSHKQKCSRP